MLVRKVKWQNLHYRCAFQKLACWLLNMYMFHVIYIPVNISKNLSDAVVWLSRTIWTCPVCDAYRGASASGGSLWCTSSSQRSRDSDTTSGSVNCAYRRQRPPEAEIDAASVACDGCARSTTVTLMRCPRRAVAIVHARDVVPHCRSGSESPWTTVPPASWWERPVTNNRVWRDVSSASHIATCDGRSTGPHTAHIPNSAGDTEITKK